MFRSKRFLELIELFIFTKKDRDRKPIFQNYEVNLIQAFTTIWFLVCTQ